jgi:TPR repeat protein
MKKLLIVSALVCSFGSFSVDAARNTEVFEYEKSSRLGFNAFNAESFENAFKHLDQAAKLGNKVAQYTLALLYLEGKGTTQDYAHAYIWLNVAAEVNEKTWRNLRDQIKSALTTEQKKSLQPHIDSYMSQYGAKAQDISCTKKARIGSHRRHMSCIKNLDVGSTRL